MKKEKGYTLFGTLSKSLTISHQVRDGIIDLRFASVHKKSSHNYLQLLPKFGINLLSHLAAVPSALWSLTSLFGMGRGGSSRL